GPRHEPIALDNEIPKALIHLGVLGCDGHGPGGLGANELVFRYDDLLGVRSRRQRDSPREGRGTNGEQMLLRPRVTEVVVADHALAYVGCAHAMLRPDGVVDQAALEGEPARI